MTLQKIVGLIEKLIEDDFFGKIEISFENGQIVFVKRTETLK